MNLLAVLATLEPLDADHPVIYTETGASAPDASKVPLVSAGRWLVLGESMSVRTWIGMSEPLRYHADSRALQEQFDSTRLADRVAQVQVRAALDEATALSLAVSVWCLCWQAILWHEVLPADDPARRLEPGAQGA